MQFKNEKNTRALFPPFIRQQNTSFVLNKKNPNNTYFFYSLSPRSPSLQTASPSLGHHLSRHLSLSQPHDLSSLTISPTLTFHLALSSSSLAIHFAVELVDSNLEHILKTWLLPILEEHILKTLAEEIRVCSLVRSSVCILEFRVLNQIWGFHLQPHFSVALRYISSFLTFIVVQIGIVGYYNFFQFVLHAFFVYF